MKATQKIIHECFFGVIGFNEKATIAAMKKYAKFYHKKKLAKIPHIVIDKYFLLQQPLLSPDETPTKPRRSPEEAPTVRLFPHF